MIIHTTIDNILNNIHKQYPHLVASIMVRDGVFVFLDKDGLPRSTLSFKQGPLNSVVADYFNFDKKLQPKETL